MDSIQERHQRAVGDAFIEWYNKQNGTGFTYHGRGAEPPDLIYCFGSQEMPLEITAAYYDAEYATMLWQNARAVPGSADLWVSKDPDQKLFDRINFRLAKKCDKRYPTRYVLVVGLYPNLTTSEELEAMIAQVKVPADHPFAEIYLAGVFPACSSGSSGGYYCWKLAERTPSPTNNHAGRWILFILLPSVASGGP
jgi:hypothetical protein